ncbi:ABC transporter permease [Kaustia mangrovi]|uniref:ABC transporter permease n=1 Tax=Kaustia mangrovi TaxID=2593653 RepID=A0A7S8HD59_9HYPH|nr:ABC transporter permease [Kaustia mangrovi]QPC44144.1 ABC transporter permease [Kaustia mangrovi]
MWRDFRASWTAMTGLGVTVFVLLCVIVVASLMPYSPTKMSFTGVLQPPSLAHLFGTDSFGRDVFTRVLYGARVSLVISGAGIALALLIGTTVGMTAAYLGRLYDLLVMRFMDLLFSFPSFVLALFLMVILGFGVVNVSIAIALVYIPIFARLAHNMTLAVREEPYVQAARLMGQHPLRLLAREILPNIAAPLMVQASIGVAFGIVIEAGLSFIGLGVQPPTPSLGVIMADGQEYFRRAPWVLTMSGLAVCFALLGLNLLGDGLRDLVDPRLRKRAE